MFGVGGALTAGRTRRTMDVFGVIAAATKSGRSVHAPDTDRLRLTSSAPDAVVPECDFRPDDDQDQTGDRCEPCSVLDML